jgi:dihydropteroate synthase
MQPRITLVGAINVSPESFYPASVPRTDAALARLARQMQQDGADVIDVGAMSTAPYLKTHISDREESRRLTRAIRVIRRAVNLPISADTSRASVAQTALAAGAAFLNDITGLHGDPGYASVARRARRVILMAHPHGLKKAARSPLAGVEACLKSTLRIAAQANIPATKIVIDPGIGFFRDTRWPWWKWDVEVLKNLKRLKELKLPLLVGVSRKSFIGALLGEKKPSDRLAGSLAATLLAVQNGASWVRTHDVKATRDGLRVLRAIGG